MPNSTNPAIKKTAMILSFQEGYTIIPFVSSFAVMDDEE
jgi:hypothetical protein